MNQRFFLENPYKAPIYRMGAGSGCLQGSADDQKQIVPKPSQRTSFSIDSILTNTCTANTPRWTPRMAKDECYNFPRSKEHRFYPYLQYPRVNIAQNNLPFVKTCTIDENKEKEEEKNWSLERPKRMRTIFTVEQLERMENEFARQQYMVGADRFFLANELGLTETQVKVWFQNRRIKWRKHILDEQQRELKANPKVNA